MKKLIYLGLILLIAACDKIDNPIPEVIGEVGDDCPIPTFAPNTSTKRNILVEDFTGHFCNNCPSAAYSIDTIKKNIGKQIIPVAIHVTAQFAAPQSAEAPKFQSDYRTAGGTEIKNSLAPAAGLPAVMVSRKDGFTGSTGRLNVFLSSLSANVRSLISDVPKVKLQTLSTFDPATNRVCAFAEVEIMDNLAEDHSLVFMLLEDSVVDWQLYNNSGGDPIYAGINKIPNYVHKHMLRKSMNGWQGKKIIEAGATAIGDKIVEGATFVITDGSWRTDHLEVVAFVYNNTTKEVIQAYSEKL